MSATGKEDTNKVQAPTYVELYNLSVELKACLDFLEKNLPSSGSASPSLPNPSLIPQERLHTDFRLLPDLNRTVPVFTGYEPSHIAEDWIMSIDALARINNWPVPYRLQYVKSNTSNAARSWYTTETFADWPDFLIKFRAVFVRTPRMTDCWKALSDRIQGESEHIADYFYDKLRLYLLSLTAGYRRKS